MIDFHDCSGSPPVDANNPRNFSIPLNNVSVIPSSESSIVLALRASDDIPADEPSSVLSAYLHALGALEVAHEGRGVHGEVSAVRCTLTFPVTRVMRIGGEVKSTAAAESNYCRDDDRISSLSIDTIQGGILVQKRDL